LKKNSPWKRTGAASKISSAQVDAGLAASRIGGRSVRHLSALMALALRPLAAFPAQAP
jgi:hypothetical protein